jgi:hypothetical protein
MSDTNIPREEVIAFRERHRLLQKDLDHLFGYKSDGRATRRWEELGGSGAPYYVRIIFTYADKYGLDTMRELAREMGFIK